MGTLLYQAGTFGLKTLPGRDIWAEVQFYLVGTLGLKTLSGEDIWLKTISGGDICLESSISGGDIWAGVHSIWW